jgi:cell division inhibitor SepF
MKFLDKILNAIGLYSEEEEQAEETPETTAPSKFPVFGTKQWEDRSEKLRREEKRSLFGKKQEDTKLISMPLAQAQVKVVVVEPINFDDCKKVADYLKKNQPVVINFEETDSDVMKRIVDFVSGTIYAINGTMKKIGRSIMVCAPQTVDIDAGDDHTSRTTTSTTSYDKRGEFPWER